LRYQNLRIFNIELPNPNSPTAKTFLSFSCINFKRPSKYSSGLLFFSNSLHLVGWQPTVMNKLSLKKYHLKIEIETLYQ
jgi:hypothetical protein